MVKAGDFWTYQRESAHHSPNLNFTRNLLLSGQQNSLPSCPPCLRPQVESSFITPNPYLNECHSPFALGLRINTTPNNATGSSKKGFFIFDRSRNQTRMFYRSLGPSSQNLFVKTTNPPCACPLCDEKQALEQISLSKPITQEGSEMREDTEEINALLYSDNDDIDYDDDKVASTGYSPFAEKGDTENYEQVGDISEDFAAFDGSAKRQKLVDGRYQKSSVVDKSCEYENGAESSCASARTQDKDTSSSLDDEQLNKDKIREIVKILGSIIPGSRGKGPLLIIDEAIDYLKSMKLKAKDLGHCYCP